MIGTDRRDLFAISQLSSVFTTEEVAGTAAMLDRVLVVERLEQWQAIDSGATRGGGRPAALNYRALIVGMILLWNENTAFHTSELSNIFWRRLNQESRELLGIGRTRISDEHHREVKLWFDRTDRAITRMFSLIDPLPARRQKMNREERNYEISLRDPDVSATKMMRLNWFINQLLHMTLLDLPPEVLAAWKGDVSVDQTRIEAPTNQGRRRWAKKGGERIGEEPQGILMEFDADWYRHKPDERIEGLDSSDHSAMTWGYAANIAVATRNDPKVSAHPLLAVAYVLGIPNDGSLPEETIEMLRSLNERGLPAGRITGDLEYFALQVPERLAMPARALGYDPLTGYRPNELGVTHNIGGAIQVGGHLYCPSMPAGIRDAAILEKAKKITEEVAAKRINEQRPKWRVKIKDQPNEDGKFTIKCPAYGIGATIDCPLREVHAKAKKAARPEAIPPPAHKRDRICKQTSVTVEPTPENLRYMQTVPHGTREWHALHGHDRSQAEGFNSVIKDPSKEAIHLSDRRRHRGYTAAAVAVAFALVNANRRLTQSWMRKKALEEITGKVAPRKTGRFKKPSIDEWTPRGPMLLADGTVQTVAEWKALKAQRDMAAKLAEKRKSAADPDGASGDEAA